MKPPLPAANFLERMATRQCTLFEALGAATLPPQRAYFLAVPDPAERNVAEQRIAALGGEFAGAGRHPFVVCRNEATLLRFREWWPDKRCPPKPAAKIPRSHNPIAHGIRRLQRDDLDAPVKRAEAPAAEAEPPAKRARTRASLRRSQLTRMTAGPVLAW